MTLSRRSLLGAMASLPAAAATASPAGVVPAAGWADPVLRDAMLRGLAQVDQRGDGVSSVAARLAVEQLAEADPEGALLFRIYRALDDRPSQRYNPDAPSAEAETLRLLQEAMADCVPVHIHYTDLEGDSSDRTVLPLALVTPPQGIKLLAYCRKAEDYRQFFVREIQQPRRVAGEFREDRIALLEGLADKEGA